MDDRALAAAAAGALRDAARAADERTGTGSIGDWLRGRAESIMDGTKIGAKQPSDVEQPRTDEAAFAYLGPKDEPQNSGAVVVVHYGDYHRQEIWVASGANIGNWYSLGGEFGRPKVVEDPRTEMQKMTARELWRQPPGTIPLHPHWSDVLARGPVTLLVPADGEAYRQGWRAGRRDLWQAMEEIAYDGPYDADSAVRAGSGEGDEPR